ncbi:MAG: asparagine synthase (glutamine-hydrolyzing) [Polyangiales bacterium]
MCGIAGLIRFDADLDRDTLEACARRMADTLRPRGPDADGYHVDPSVGLALAHRRLSIVDLSAAGAQPMTSHSGRLTVVFNGEIYNHEAMRAALPGRAWRGHSDTEVLLEAIDAWGLDEALRRAVGMFALALWDADRRALSFARDRMGEKPLYYGLIDGALAFGSELKALRAAIGWRGTIDRVALDDLMRHGNVHGPRSIFENVRKLPAGTTLAVSLADARRALSLTPSRYWSLVDVAEHGGHTPADDREATDALEGLLSQAIDGQRVAVVPVGAFLSGGVDSSLVVALMQRAGGRAVKTFSIGFREPEYNEAPYAKRVAEHLGTEHTELYVTLDDARDVIPSLPEMFCEPFADSSQLPTYLVAKLARQHVTVSLSGDGGDELFGGYSRYPSVDRMWRALDPMPEIARKGFAAGLRALPPSTWNALGAALPRRVRPSLLGDKLHKLAGVAGSRSALDVYDMMLAHHRDASPLVRGVDTPTRVGAHPLWTRPGRDLYDNMMLADALGYLPDVIMVKVDRATMAVSLEARAPFLDHRVVEYAFGLPTRFKVRDGTSKWLLREVLYRHVPRSLIERPKMGFNVPIDQWLRGPLRAWADDLLSPSRLASQGYLHAETIRKAWDDHTAGRRNLQHLLWNALMFEAWLDVKV